MSDDLADIDLRTASVRDELTTRLRTAIVEGRFQPGERMVERKLCEWLQVSRPSLRETLRQLEAEGLVEITPHRGPAVRMIGRAEVLHLWELRQAIGLLAVRRFAEQRSASAIARLEDAIQAQADALDSRDAPAIKRTKNAVFECLAAGSGNPPLMQAFRQINAQLSFLWASSLDESRKRRADESINEFAALLAAIRDGNPDVAQAVFVVYSEHTKTSALHSLRQREQAVAAKPRSRAAARPNLSAEHD